MGACEDGFVLWALSFVVCLTVWSYAAYAACLSTIFASGCLTQIALTYDCFATLAFPADACGIVEFIHPTVGPSWLLVGDREAEVGLEGLP